MPELSPKLQKLLEQLRVDHADEEIIDACCDGSWLGSRTVTPEEVEQLYNYLMSKEDVNSEQFK